LFLSCSVLRLGEVADTEILCLITGYKIITFLLVAITSFPEGAFCRLFPACTGKCISVEA
jgi:hypothetical protein